jgi:hypothetical protein
LLSSYICLVLLLRWLLALPIISCRNLTVRKEYIEKASFSVAWRRHPIRRPNAEASGAFSIAMTSKVHYAALRLLLPRM